MIQPIGAPMPQQPEESTWDKLAKGFGIATSVLGAANSINSLAGGAQAATQNPNVSSGGPSLGVDTPLPQADPSNMFYRRLMR